MDSYIPPIAQPNPEPLAIPNYFGKKVAGIKDEFVETRNVSFTQINKPVRVRPTNSLLLIGALNVAFAGLLIYCLTQKFLSKKSITEITFLVILYVVYLVVALLNEQISNFTQNTRKPSEYLKLFQNMKGNNCYLKFRIECYHFVKKGKNSRRKIVTHEAQEEFHFEEVTDNSGEIKEIKDNNSIIFVHYRKRFSIPNLQLKKEVIKKFNQFVFANFSDKHQKYSVKVEIPGFEEYVCYAGTTPLVPIMELYRVCAVIGLALPYLLFVESMVTRYEIKTHKILGK